VLNIILPPKGLYIEYQKRVFRGVGGGVEDSAKKGGGVVKQNFPNIAGIRSKSKPGGGPRGVNDLKSKLECRGLKTGGGEDLKLGLLRGAVNIPLSPKFEYHAQGNGKAGVKKRLGGKGLSLKQKSGVHLKNFIDRAAGKKFGETKKLGESVGGKRGLGKKKRIVQGQKMGTFYCGRNPPWRKVVVDQEPRTQDLSGLGRREKGDSWA